MKKPVRRVELKKVVDGIWEYIETLKDKKYQKNIKMNFPSSVIMALCAVMGTDVGDSYKEYTKEDFQYYLEM